MEFFYSLIFVVNMIVVRASSHQASASILLQLCDNASDSVLIEINGDASKWIANPFWSCRSVNQGKNCQRDPENSHC